VRGMFPHFCRRRAIVARSYAQRRGEVLVNRVELAALLKARGFPCTVSTLETMCSRGGGPPFLKAGRRVLYRLVDVEMWLETKLTGPFTSSSDRAYPTRAPKEN
jgi:hypothetical protein